MVQGKGCRESRLLGWQGAGRAGFREGRVQGGKGVEKEGARQTGSREGRVQGEHGWVRQDEQGRAGQGRAGYGRTGQGWVRQDEQG
jgi:hypothetical protein